MGSTMKVVSFTRLAGDDPLSVKSKEAIGLTVDLHPSKRIGLDGDLRYRPLGTENVSLAIGYAIHRVRRSRNPAHVEANVGGRVFRFLHGP